MNVWVIFYQVFVFLCSGKLAIHVQSPSSLTKLSRHCFVAAPTATTWYTPAGLIIVSISRIVVNINVTVARIGQIIINGQMSIVRFLSWSKSFPSHLTHFLCQALFNKSRLWISLCHRCASICLLFSACLTVPIVHYLAKRFESTVN